MLPSVCALLALGQHPEVARLSVIEWQRAEFARGLADVVRVHQDFLNRMDRAPTLAERDRIMLEEIEKIKRESREVDQEVEKTLEEVKRLKEKLKERDR